MRRGTAGLVAAALALAACSPDDERVAAGAPSAGAPSAKTQAARAPATTSYFRRLLLDAGSGKASARDIALDTLVKSGDAARAAAEEAIASDDAYLRRGGARVLERVADASSAPALAAALARPQPLEEDALVRALLRVGTSDAARSLVTVALGDDPRRALLAGAALADAKATLDVAALRAAAAAADKPFHVREAALLALGGHAEKEDRALFDAASRDTAAPIRGAAVRGLLSIEPVAAEDLRRLLLDDAEPAVRRIAAEEAARVKCADAVAALAKASREFDEDVATAAVESLAKRREPAAFDALLDAVRDDSHSAHVRGAAARLAAALDRDRTVAMLKNESAIFDLETRVYCDEILRAKESR